MYQRLIIFLFFLGLASTVNAVCVLPLCQCNVSSSALNFGQFNPLTGSNKDSSSTVQVSCLGPVASVGVLVPIQISLGKGLGSTSFTQRRMQSGGNTLSYNLYKDAAKTQVWGDGTSGSSILSTSLILGVGNITLLNTIYGSIYAGQTATKPGQYSDSVTITITYY